MLIKILKILLIWRSVNARGLHMMSWFCNQWNWFHGPWRKNNSHDLFLVRTDRLSCVPFSSLNQTWFSFFFSFIFISWRLITLQYCSGFCHALTWISHGFTCVPHPDPPSRLPLSLIPLGLPSAPAPSTCLMHPTWAGKHDSPDRHDVVFLHQLALLLP